VGTALGSALGSDDGRSVGKALGDGVGRELVATTKAEATLWQYDRRPHTKEVN